MPSTLFPDSKTTYFANLLPYSDHLSAYVLLEPVLSPWKDAKCLLTAERVTFNTCIEDKDLQRRLGLAKIFILSVFQVLNFKVSKD